MKQVYLWPFVPIYMFCNSLDVEFQKTKKMRFIDSTYSFSIKHCAVLCASDCTCAHLIKYTKLNLLPFYSQHCM